MRWRIAEDGEIWMKLRDSGPKILEAVSRTLQIEAMYQPESSCKGSPKEENREFVELIKQSTSAIKQQHPS